MLVKNDTYQTQLSLETSLRCHVSTRVKSARSVLGPRPDSQPCPQTPRSSANNFSGAPHSTTYSPSSAATCSHITTPSNLCARTIIVRDPYNARSALRMLSPFFSSTCAIASSRRRMCFSDATALPLDRVWVSGQVDRVVRHKSDEEGRRTWSVSSERQRATRAKSQQAW